MGTLNTKTSPATDQKERAKSERVDVEIVVHPDNPLSNQLEKMTGHGWNTWQWTDTLGKTGIITHKETGLRVKVYSKRHDFKDPS